MHKNKKRESSKYKRSKKEEEFRKKSIGTLKNN
jgi:hypothetical protein